MSMYCLKPKKKTKKCVDPKELRGELKNSHKRGAAFQLLFICGNELKAKSSEKSCLCELVQNF